jgi:hypothetical protein
MQNLALQLAALALLSTHHADSPPRRAQTQDARHTHQPRAAATLPKQKSILVYDEYSKQHIEVKKYKPPRVVAAVGSSAAKAKKKPRTSKGLGFVNVGGADEKWLALQTWLEDQGGKADGLAVAEVAPGLRGVVTTRPFAKGETLL